MRELQSKIAVLTGKSKNAQADKAIRDLADEFRYSDPVSSLALKTIESDLSAAIDDLQNAVIEDDLDGIIMRCGTITDLLKERNRRCKLEKQH